MSDDFLRDLVDGERAALVPSAGAREKTWKKVARSVAIAAPVPAAAVPGGAGWAGKAWWATSWAKGLALALVGGAVVIGVLASRGERETVAVPESAAAPESIASAQPPELPPAGGRALAPHVDAQTVLPEPAEQVAPTLAPATDEALVPMARSSKPRAVAPSTDDGPDDALAGSSLAEEARLVVAARRDLRAGSPRAALSSLHEHAKRFPHGQLTEERMALTARALCESGDTDSGRRHAENLRAAFPSSSHLRRVDRACESSR
jgi:hypothetical protein